MDKSINSQDETQINDSNIHGKRLVLISGFEFQKKKQSESFIKEPSGKVRIVKAGVKKPSEGEGKDIILP
jgi:hypothetical protein